MIWNTKEKCSCCLSIILYLCPKRNWQKCPVYRRTLINILTFTSPESIVWDVNYCNANMLNQYMKQKYADQKKKWNRNKNHPKKGNQKVMTSSSECYSKPLPACLALTRHRQMMDYSPYPTPFLIPIK